MLNLIAQRVQLKHGAELGLKHSGMELQKHGWSRVCLEVCHDHT